MNDLTNDIKHIFKNRLAEEKEAITRETIAEAIHNIKSVVVIDSSSLFLCLCSINLLNAAIKRTEFKDKLSYGFIKTHARMIAEKLLDNERLFEAELYYDSYNHCLYIKQWGVVFSFHHIQETPKIVLEAGQKPVIGWPGIRLQEIAQELFYMSKDMYYKNFNMSYSMIDLSDASNVKEETTRKTVLIDCPDCGHKISSSAVSCPSCGRPIATYDEIIKQCRIGDSVQINCNEKSYNGVISKLGLGFLELTWGDSKWIRIKTNAIDSIEYLGATRISIELFAQQVDQTLSKIVNLEKFDLDSLIICNSTITQIENNTITIITDSGQVLTCQAKRLFGFSKKYATIGKRLYCECVDSNGKNILGIYEITHRSLITGFRRVLLNKTSRYVKWRNCYLHSLFNYLLNVRVKNPEAYIEIKKLKESLFKFLLQTNNELVIGNLTSNLPSDNSSVESPNLSEKKEELYQTETERQLAHESAVSVKVVGKIDLDSISSTKKKLRKSEENENIPKPKIVYSPETRDWLSRELPPMSEDKCKLVERELDQLVRTGQKEECLRRSYNIINSQKPTFKYLRSYLDRIVNTEIALGHSEAAVKALAYLIALNDQQKHSNLNTLGHLYLTLSRQLLKINQKEEALIAINYAYSLRPDNALIVKLRDQIKKESTTNDPKTQESQFHNSNDNNLVSKMLQQDVEEEVKRVELIPIHERSTSNQLFGNAQTQRENDKMSHEDRAKLFLESAASYYIDKQTDTVMYKTAVATYAKLKGDSMYARFAALLKDDYSNRIEILQAYRDSACSYYLETLGIFNGLGANGFLQELLLKYLRLTLMMSQLEGGKTPQANWERATLKEIQSECLSGDVVEKNNILFNSYIAIGATVEEAWNTLYETNGGEPAFFGKFDKSTCKQFNSLEGTNIKLGLTTNRFLHSSFQQRKTKTNNFQLILEQCLAWPFDQFDISSFENIWSKVDTYTNLMTSTDLRALSAINESIDVMRQYSSSKDDERTRRLGRVQRILLNSQKEIKETTTFYGRVFFSHIVEKWLVAITQLLDERDVVSYPRLVVTPEPSFIKTDNDEKYYIDFLVTNDGESTADSFIVNISFDNEKDTIEYNQTLPAGECCSLSLYNNSLRNKNFTNVKFEIIAKYQNKALAPCDFEATYEKENARVLEDEKDIPWKISNTPKASVFKGREKDLDELVSHYLSKDRTFTYIIYGLTRTGKSSILDYLCERIDGKTFVEDNTKRIMTFKWDLSRTPYKNSSAHQLWVKLLEDNIYNKLSDELVGAVDASYADRQWPIASELCQTDLEHIINALNDEGIVPLITIDEFSYIKPMLKEGAIDATFLSTLRNFALKGKACFVYAGTYEIKDLPKEKEYGLEGQMTNTKSLPIWRIDDVYANELMDACKDMLEFTDSAKAYIRNLSGCVPYWIQWICLDCGKYAIAHKKHYLGYKEVDYVVKILTGESNPMEIDTWGAMDDTNFHNNMIDPGNLPERQLITCITSLSKDKPQNNIGVSMNEIKNLWDKYGVTQEKRLELANALNNLIEKKVIRQFTDETREVYCLEVDLFRRWWSVHHKDLNLELSL